MLSLMKGNTNIITPGFVDNFPSRGWAKSPRKRSLQKLAIQSHYSNGGILTGAALDISIQHLVSLICKHPNVLQEGMQSYAHNFGSKHVSLILWP